MSGIICTMKELVAKSNTESSLLYALYCIECLKNSLHQFLKWYGHNLIERNLPELISWLKMISNSRLKSWDHLRLKIEMLFFCYKIKTFDLTLWWRLNDVVVDVEINVACISCKLLHNIPYLENGH